MKLVGIVGSPAEKSYNRLLLQFIANNFSDLIDLEIIDIDNIPLFNQSEDQTHTEPIQNLNRKIKAADGVIIATPEHNRTVPAGLKSVLEWLSFKIHPLENKPVLIVGASYYDQGTSRAQLHLRQILESPGVGAFAFPGNEFLLGKAKEAFDENNQLKDEGTVKFLRSVLEKFVRFVNIIQQIEGDKPTVLEPEDLNATGKSATTIEGVDMYAEDWVEQAAEKTNAVSGNTYVELDRGILTVDQINHFLNSMPMELTFADDNNQFIYYNYHIEKDDMLASRHPSQVGNPLAACHPEAAHKNVAWVIQQLRSGQMDTFRIKVPTHGPDKFVVHSYKGIKDKEGQYIGVNEYVQDIQPIIDWYLEQTGQELVGSKTDAVSGASKNDNNVDGVSGASENTNESAKSKEADAVSGASANTNPPAPEETIHSVDAVSGASENA
ncbi:MAG TPA: NAD(P)H-dependent oxidoreductase [Candidatus Atopostipes pullistercoris]|uniref:NAD(P)H-dependent oxidoreductase n=1 Tax=Candidatus Atopostipes pullistercoris TaxID=2838467 RepID=A0A9D2G0S1_9LACT|nr:NAD(P)H-dependent oxidoreductase [Candidatus Atopostipes pullistercoris]